MANYVLIESRDPFEHRSFEEQMQLAKGLSDAGNDVTVFLVENGVLAARPSGASKALDALKGSGVKLLADEFSVRERGIRADKMASGVKAESVDFIVDAMAAGNKVIWH